MRTITKNVSSLPVGADYFFKESIMKEYDLLGQLKYWKNKLYDTTMSIEDLTMELNMVRRNIDSIEWRLNNITEDILNGTK